MLNLSAAVSSRRFDDFSKSAKGLLAFIICFSNDIQYDFERVREIEMIYLIQRKSISLFCSIMSNS